MTTHRSRASLSAVLFALFLLPDGLAAQSLPLDFEPPDVEVTPICVPRSSDADLIAEWRAWDGKVLPDRDPELINRDLRRLAELDPVAWDATIQKAITLLPSVSPSFSADHVALARIEQMIALGELQKLKAAGLVQHLLDRGDQNSPRMLNALSDFLNEGIGIDRDTARGAELLMAAGYGGNADALLALSHLAVAGEAPEGWDVSPELAVTMAFGSLVGQMDPLICDRISRIARAFASGDVVAVDHDLAVRWYRFAADLGDPIAAWRVAEYHLQSELVKKDNDVLLTYLTKAANGNLPYAQVALGRVYEAGALVPMDLERAQSLYEAAAATGDRAALIRLSGFLEAQVSRRPDLEPAFLDTLNRLQAFDYPPGWVYAKQAAHVLDVKGRWAGQDAARALLEKGAAMDDPAAIVMLAQMVMGSAKTDSEFYAAVDQLIQAVTNLGEVAPTADLQAAFLCKAPTAPHLREAAYWAEAEAAIGSSSLELTDMGLAQLADDPDPLAMAALQTQALYGRATPLANLLDVLGRGKASDSEVAFWTAYSDRFPNVATARASLALDQAQSKADRTAALDAFRAAVTAGEDGAALKLAKALLDGDTDQAARAEAVDLLVPLAQAGTGEAMQLLPVADPATYPNSRAVYQAFAQAIGDRGDFFAIALALPFLPDPASREVFHDRAITAMQCAFPEAIAFATAMGALGEGDEARRWLSIATRLADKDPWQIVQLADTFRAVFGADGEETALAYYRQAHALGDRTAVQRLLRIYGNPAQPGYDRARVVSLYVDLVSGSNAKQIAAVLDEISRKEPNLRLAVEAKLDLDSLYAEAAEAGNPAAMREHSVRLRSKAANKADMAIATDWLLRASEAGDVPAMVMLAQAYSLGVGVPISVESARIWLQKAAEAGDPTAIDMVKMFTVDEETN